MSDAIAPSRVATIAPDDMLKLMHNYPTLTRANRLAELAATVAARCAAQKVDELELLYDDADFL
jgi:hypothetical protein